LATPLAALIAVRWFVPFYRHTGEVSAYEHLEHRFGRWARSYATICFLLLQVSRTGSIMYLMAIAVQPLIGWSVKFTIVAAAVLMTFYTLTGGMRAVVWTGVLQSGVLIAGTALTVAVLVLYTPGGLPAIIHYGAANHKFDLGDFSLSLTSTTFWVMLAFGFVTHLANFGVDQSFIQRYLTARDDREARKSIWLTTALYVPVAGVFFLIGTALWVFYRLRADLPGSIDSDHVFPHFIATQLPAGVGGLVVAAVFAASMDSNLNSMATLTLCDIYKPYFRPRAGERESQWVLYASTVLWGLASIVIAFGMIPRGKNALDQWWKLSGAFSGPILGIFLLSLACKKATSAAALFAATIGVLLIIWMSPPSWMELPQDLRSQLDGNLTMVVGTLSIFLVGWAVAAVHNAFRGPAAQSAP
ncbi:MAG: sodium:solute symporter, partial [Pirellulales bacterium]|nr:sodium:solute symporter [Pirellulales bacterium]